MKMKWVSSLLVIIVVALSLESTAEANDIFYSGTTPSSRIVLKWNYKSGTKLYLTISDDKATTGPLGSYYTGAINKWISACPSTLLISDVSWSNSRIDYVAPTLAFFSSRKGDLNEQINRYNGLILAFTDNYDTNSLLIETTANAQASTKRICSAAIYESPYPQAFDGSIIDVVTAAMKPTILAHELGHVMGIGHSNTGPEATTTASIMNSDCFSMASSPTTFDKNAVISHTP